MIFHTWLKAIWALVAELQSAHMRNGLKWLRIASISKTKYNLKVNMGCTSPWKTVRFSLYNYHVLSLHLWVMGTVSWAESEVFWKQERELAVANSELDIFGNGEATFPMRKSRRFQLLSQLTQQRKILQVLSPGYCRFIAGGQEQPISSPIRLATLV
jgi:hypothetical protein